MLIWDLSLLMKLLISIMLVKHTVAQINIKKLISKSATLQIATL